MYNKVHSSGLKIQYFDSSLKESQSTSNDHAHLPRIYSNITLHLSLYLPRLKYFILREKSINNLHISLIVFVTTNNMHCRKLLQNDP